MDINKVISKIRYFNENVSSGRAKQAKYGRVNPKATGSITNDQKSIEFDRKKKENKLKDKEVASKVDVSGLSPADAYIKRKIAQRKAEKGRLRLKEEAPANAVGGGHIAGVGVGPQGEPGVDMRRKKQRNWNPFFKDMARVIRRNSKKNGK